MNFKTLLIFAIVAISSAAGHSQLSPIKCDSVFPYKGSNWKYGLSSTNGRGIAEPQFDEFILVNSNLQETFCLFLDRELEKCGVVNSYGTILTDKLPGLPNSTPKFIGCIISYINYQGDLVVYSGCLEKLIGIYPKGAINFDLGVIKVPTDNPQKKAMPKFAVFTPASNEGIFFNSIGEKLSHTNQNKGDLTNSCKKQYYFNFPIEYRNTKKSISNVDTYQRYYPHLKIIEEYFSQDGSLSILAKKDKKYGLINPQDVILLQFEYNKLKF